MFTDATYSVYSEVMTKDTLIVGIGYSSSYPTSNLSYVQLNGASVAYRNSMWSFGSSYVLSWIFTAPKGSTVTFYYVRYYKITED